MINQRHLLRVSCTLKLLRKKCMHWNVAKQLNSTMNTPTVRYVSFLRETREGNRLFPGPSFGILYQTGPPRQRSVRLI